MKKRSLILAVAVAAVSSGVALAASETPAAPTQAESAAAAKAHRLFVKLDKNKDGVIDKAESRHLRGLYREFGKVAKDGKIDEASFTAWETARHEAKRRMHQPMKAAPKAE